MSIPADSDEKNDDRAEWARAAVRHFQILTGLGEADGLDTAISDLLADIAHLCDREDLDFYHLLQQSGAHYLAETTPQDTRGTQYNFLGEY
jgi:hypothetical protein